MSEPTVAGAETGAEKAASNVEAVVNAILPAAAAFGPVGVEAAAGIGVAENVANAIISATSNHEAPLAIAAGAATALVNNAQPVLATLPAASQEKAKDGLNLLQTILADLQAIFHI